MTLTVTFTLKIAISDFVGGCHWGHSVSKIDLVLLFSK